MKHPNLKIGDSVEIKLNDFYKGKLKAFDGWIRGEIRKIDGSQAQIVFKTHKSDRAMSWFHLDNEDEVALFPTYCKSNW